MSTLTRIARSLAPFALVAGISVAAVAQTPAPKSDGALAVATFAGGCFWCMEEAYEKVPGVIRAVSGYIGGTVDKPTYEQVSAKVTGHYEAVQVTYDPTKVSYPQLVDWFWRNIDPVDARGQFCDKGSPYYTAIFTHDDAQRKVAEETKQTLEASGRLKGERVATKVLPATAFWPAEDYHQDYYKKNPNRYYYYKTACGRAQRLEQIWGPPKPPQTPTQ
jgi:peptide-methionine (S)-S-oxide reductase